MVAALEVTGSASLNDISSQPNTERLDSIPYNRGHSLSHTVNTSCSVVPYIPCKILLQCIFFIANAAFLPLLIYIKYQLQITYQNHKHSQLYSTPMNCATRMLYWGETFLTIWMATKIGVLLVLLKSLFQFKLFKCPVKCVGFFSTISYCIEWVLPFGFGFKLFWHFCGGVMLLDITACRPNTPSSESIYVPNITEKPSSMTMDIVSLKQTIHSDTLLDPLILIIHWCWWLSFSLYILGVTLLCMAAMIVGGGQNRIPEFIAHVPNDRYDDSHQHHDVAQQHPNQDHIIRSRYMTHIRQNAARSRQDDDLTYNNHHSSVPVNNRDWNIYHENDRISGILPSSTTSLQFHPLRMSQEFQHYDSSSMVILVESYRTSHRYRQHQRGIHRHQIATIPKCRYSDIHQYHQIHSSEKKHMYSSLGPQRTLSTCSVASAPCEFHCRLDEEPNILLSPNPLSTIVPMKTDTHIHLTDNESIRDSHTEQLDTTMPINNETEYSDDSNHRSSSSLQHQSNTIHVPQLNYPYSLCNCMIDNQSILSFLDHERQHSNMMYFPSYHTDIDSEIDQSYMMTFHTPTDSYFNNFPMSQISISPLSEQHLNEDSITSHDFECSIVPHHNISDTFHQHSSSSNCSQQHVEQQHPTDDSPTTQSHVRDPTHLYPTEQPLYPLTTTSLTVNDYINLCPKMYYTVLALVYFLITITDITTAPQCCVDPQQDSRQDEFIARAIYTLNRYRGSYCCRMLNRMSQIYHSFLYRQPTIRSRARRRRRQRELKKKKSQTTYLNKQQISKIHHAIEETISDNTLCCICCTEYVSDDQVMLLPCPSRHYFHLECARTWLTHHNTCPLCRYNIIYNLQTIRPTVTH